MAIKQLKIYYVVMMLILVSWSAVGSPPPIVLSIGYLIALLYPIFHYKKEWIGCIFIMFCIVSANHFVPSYMPALSGNLLICFLTFFIFCKAKNQEAIRPPLIITSLIFIITFVETFVSESNYNNVWLLILIILIFYSTNKHDTGLFHRLSQTFIIISFVLSIDLLINGWRFAYDVVTSIGSMAREDWNDSNYFSAILGMGILASAIEMSTMIAPKKMYRRFIIVSILLSIIAMLRVASRGAILSLALSVSIFILFSSMRKTKKIGSILAICLLTTILYYIGSLDLIVARFSSDDGTAGDRTIIWTEKYSAFVSESNVYNWIFGFGRQYGRRLGYGTLQGFHNDYVAFFVEYGILGFLIFTIFTLYPLIKIKSANKGALIACTVYLITICFSLEPFAGGYFAEYFFWVYCVVIAHFTQNLNCGDYKNCFIN